MEESTQLQKLISEFILSFKQNICKTCLAYNKVPECVKLSKSNKCKYDKFSYVHISNKLAEYLIKEGYGYDGRRKNK